MSENSSSQYIIINKKEYNDEKKEFYLLRELNNIYKKSIDKFKENKENKNMKGGNNDDIKQLFKTRTEFVEKDTNKYISEKNNQNKIISESNMKDKKPKDSEESYVVSNMKEVEAPIRKREKREQQDLINKLTKVLSETQEDKNIRNVNNEITEEKKEKKEKKESSDDIEISESEKEVQEKPKQKITTLKELGWDTEFYEQFKTKRTEKNPEFENKEEIISEKKSEEEKSVFKKVSESSSRNENKEYKKAITQTAGTIDSEEQERRTIKEIKREYNDLIKAMSERNLTKMEKWRLENVLKLMKKI
jgi:hypothetical protein